MKLLLKISWRNIWRHRRRSLVVVASISLGIFVMTVTMGFMNGFSKQMVDNVIKTSLGHIAIHQKGYQDDMKLEYSFQFTNEFEEQLKKNKRVKYYAPRIKAFGALQSAEAIQPVIIVGIDPQKEKHVSNIFDYTSSEKGSRFLQNIDDDGIIVSQTLASKMDIQIGDTMLNIRLGDRNKKLAQISFPVRGFFTSPIESFDKGVVFVGLKKLQKLVALENNISEVTIITPDRDVVVGLTEQLKKEINSDNFEVLSWIDMQPQLKSAVELNDKMLGVFFMIVFVTIIFSVANTLIMAVMERFHEIGVMKSIGTRPRFVFAMVVFEAFCLGILGLVVGVSSGILVNSLLIGTGGIDLSAFNESVRLWGSGSIIFPVIRIKDIVMASGIVFMTTIIAAIYPAIKAARIKPLEALNFI